MAGLLISVMALPQTSCLVSLIFPWIELWACLAIDETRNAGSDDQNLIQDVAPADFTIPIREKLLSIHVDKPRQSLFNHFIM